MEAAGQSRRAPQRPPPPNTNTDDSHTHTRESIRNLRDLQRVHDSAHTLIQSGLEADERNDGNGAMRCYSEGLRLINKALRIDCEQFSNTSDETDQAKLMLQKMTKTKQQITYRVQSLQKDHQNDLEFQARTEADGPPSYEDAMREPSAPPGFMDDEMMSLGDSILSSEVDSQTLTNAIDLFTIDSGVQIFYISPDGLVSAPSYPSSLHVVKLPEGDQAASHSSESTFIHVNDWVYPLVPGSSPALQTRYGAYMFPDLMAQQAGAAVGLMLPDSVSPETRQKFEQIIRSLTVYQTQTAESPTSERQETERKEERVSVTERGLSEESMDTSAKISKGIVTASEWIAWGLSKGAEKAGALIKVGSEKIREKTKPATQDHKVDPRIKKGLVYARRATHVSVQVTGYLVSKLGEATSALAKEIAPHIREKGGKILPQSVTKTDGSGKSKLDGVVEVAASGLKGFGTVYVSLETAAKTLGRSLANETVSCVHHKYGAEASKATEHTMFAAGNAAMTAFNANNFGVKAVAKRAAKDTGKALVGDLNKDKSDHRGYVPCESSNGIIDSRVDNYSNGEEERHGAMGGAGIMKTKQ